MIKVTINDDPGNKQLPPTGGVPSEMGPSIDPFPPDAMSKAEFSARSLFIAYLGLIVQIAQNKELRDAFTDHGSTNGKAREMLKDTGIIVPDYVDRIYLDERKRFCGVNYWNGSIDTPIALDIEETGKTVWNEQPGLDVFATEEITIILPDGSLLPQGDFEKSKCRISDYPPELKDKYRYYYHISHPYYQELNLQIEGIGKETDTISVRVPYCDVENQAIQNYKLSGKDDIVLCSC